MQTQLAEGSALAARTGGNAESLRLADMVFGCLQIERKSELSRALRDPRRLLLGPPPLVFLQIPLAQPQEVRGDLEQLVVLEELQRLLERGARS
jgi:hypothetical protein